MNQVQNIKQRFGIIGNSALIDRAINTAVQVAPTDLTILITGESGVGKEAFSQIIHSLSKRKHSNFIAINCGAIPEGTIDSELFGHVKGSFTNAIEDRKGYFESAQDGTIFLDEVAELPINTQARLLRILENGEYIRVGSSKVQKASVRVIAATNVDIIDAVNKKKFREDLYYRLNTVPIYIPPLRERKEDIYLLFRKFAVNFQEKYSVPDMKLSESAKEILTNYNWPGNVRQLKNITEQIIALEGYSEKRLLEAKDIEKYIPNTSPNINNLPTLIDTVNDSQNIIRDILYKALFEIKKDVIDIKKNMSYLIQHISDRVDEIKEEPGNINAKGLPVANYHKYEENNLSINEDKLTENIVSSELISEETLSLSERETELIKKALKKHNGKRRLAAQELGISERTLYRKIKDLDLAIE
ncbi:MAG: sigma-54 interaction domain-containing protein [Solitalea-like symbiont of Tyrophagus putrescentiae]